MCLNDGLKSGKPESMAGPGGCRVRRPATRQAGEKGPGVKLGLRYRSLGLHEENPLNQQERASEVHADFQTATLTLLPEDETANDTLSDEVLERGTDSD